MGKNKQLIVIVLSLIAVIGVSLAYFTVSSLISGNGSSVQGTTATIQGSTITVEGTLEFNDLDILPGHKNVSSIKITATGDNTLIPYNVIWNGENTLNTPLNYTVYKTSSEIEVDSTCKDTREVVDGAYMYYEECEITNIEELGTAISTGTINTSEEKVTLVKDEFITSTPSGDEMYYYIILEYPNLNEAQNIDIGGSFNGEITIEESNVEPDINIIAAYIEQEDGTYEEVSDIPQDGYIINTEKSVCSNNAVPSWDLTDNSLKVSSLTKSGTSCYLYFEEATARDIILAGKDIQERTDFSSALTTNTNGIIYQEETSDGTTYYFAGNTTENWVSFAGYYWRIIRVNEDGSIRMIYNGITTDQMGEGTQLQISSFNSSRDNNAYVGYMYTLDNVHGTGTDSGIKKIVDNFYRDHIAGKFEHYISKEAGFCGDRTRSTSESSLNNSGGTGTTQTYYGAYIRLETNKTPTFECSDEAYDLYTAQESSKGNHALTYPIGLITADEVAYAGGVNGSSNSSYYLCTNQDYWTMSPYDFFTLGYASAFLMNSNGSLTWSNVNVTDGVRPVLNLDAGVTLIGDGTVDLPYQVVMS